MKSILAAALGLALVASTGCQQPDARPPTANHQSVVQADVAAVARTNVMLQVEVPFTIDSYYATPITSKLEAHVEEVHADIGDEVEAGAELVTLRADEVVQRRAQAEQRWLEAKQLIEQRKAAIASATARQEEALARREAARALEAQRATELRRITRLVSFGSLQKAREEEAQFALDAAKAQLRQAEAEIATAQAAAAEARETLRSAEANVAVMRAALAEMSTMTSYLQIRAPFDGIVTTRSASPGALVRPTSQGGAALMTVEKVDPLRVVCFLPLHDAAYLDVGDSLKLVATPRIPQLDQTLKIKRIARAFDRHSRMMRAEAELPNPPGKGRRRFRPGDYGKAVLTLHVFENALVVPTAAVGGSHDEGFFVMKVDAQRICHRLAVEIVHQSSDQTAIELLHGALEAGDWVIRKQPAEFHDRQRLDEVSK